MYYCNSGNYDSAHTDRTQAVEYNRLLAVLMLQWHIDPFAFEFACRFNTLIHGPFALVVFLMLWPIDLFAFDFACRFNTLVHPFVNFPF